MARGKALPSPDTPFRQEPEAPGPTSFWVLRCILNEVLMKTVRSDCAICNGSTNHFVLVEHREQENDPYAWAVNRRIVQCCGCDHKSFREEQEDLEFTFTDEEGEEDYPVTIKIYPKPSPGQKEIADALDIPELVQRIYKETILAIREGAMILAGLGLRGTIEAVCNDREIRGRTLDQRISKLALDGFISKNDANRLHAIRFLGNDAAHEIAKPKDGQINVALRIVEHLLISVYLLDAEAEGTLDTIIDSLDSLIKLLKRKGVEFEVGTEQPLRSFLGRDVRRVPNLSVLEGQLTAKIADGSISEFSIGRIENGKDGAAVQHFITNVKPTLATKKRRSQMRAEPPNPENSADDAA